MSVETVNPIEYAMLSGATAKSIMNKTGAKLADVKCTALQLKREGVISEEEAQKYFDAQETTTAPRAKKKEDTPAAAHAKRGRPDKAKKAKAAVTESEAVTEVTPTRRRRGKNA